MAAAAVGKPVALAAIGPKSRKKKTDATPGPSEQTSTEQLEPKPPFQAGTPLLTPEAIAAAVDLGLKIRKKAGSIVIGFLLVAVVVTGITLFRSRDRANASPVQEPASVVQPPRPMPVTRPAVSTLAPAPQSESTVEPVATKPPSEPPAEIRVEASKKQLQREAEQARTQLIDQMKEALNLQTAEMSQFKADCEKRLNDNTNKIAGLSRSYKNSIGQNNDKLRGKVTNLFETEADVLSKLQAQVQILSSTPQSSPQPVYDLLQDRIAKMKKAQQQITTYLDELDSDIAKAPAKKGFLFFK